MAMAEKNLYFPEIRPNSSSRKSQLELSFSSSSSSSFAELTDILCRSCSPQYHLDYARSVEIYDFCTNGVELELDEYDHYQIELRRCPSPSSYGRNQHNHINLSRYSPPNSKPVKHRSCVFCKNNGEPLSVYGSHVLKDQCGRVTCPILRRYTCPICGCSGDLAHTLKYCPLNSKRRSVSPRP